MKSGFVYIMTNKNNTVLYTGVTSNLLKRVMQHRNRSDPRQSFTYRYRLTKLVYYEFSENIIAAISREKQLKGGSRAKKVAIINILNHEWNDLYNKLN